MGNTKHFEAHGVRPGRGGLRSFIINPTSASDGLKRAIQDSLDDDSVRCDDNADDHKRNSAMGSKSNGSKRVEMDSDLVVRGRDDGDEIFIEDFGNEAKDEQRTMALDMKSRFNNYETQVSSLNEMNHRGIEAE
ncbi:unnamed protein product [Ilex paraguariensis]|uniref:Uncharacterized protein n=1 Tax=Ilex paraguariensis TaxID=185542 RepID=A0ABC8R4L6_9AQUA